MDAETARGIRWVLTDIDDTMTKDGLLVPEAYAALCALAEAGLRVIAVTGRSAGWGEVHLQEWPLAGVITENGAISFYRGEDGGFASLVHPSAVENTDPSFARAAEAAYRAVPRARPAGDNHFRRYDYAIDHAEAIRPALSADEVARIVAIFAAEGLTARPSSIHINCWKGTFDKKESSLAFLAAREGYDDARDRSRVLYIGDAPNDEAMFGWFPNACAVANVDRWLDVIGTRPSWVSGGRFGEGFAEIARQVLLLRSAKSR
jgi:HAD superfamily hydrolase (TIGR01484 family)